MNEQLPIFLHFTKFKDLLDNLRDNMDRQTDGRIDNKDVITTTKKLKQIWL